MKKVRVANFSARLTTLPKRMLTGVGTDRSEMIVTVDQAAALPVRERKG